MSLHTLVLKIRLSSLDTKTLRQSNVENRNLHLIEIKKCPENLCNQGGLYEAIFLNLISNFGQTANQIASFALVYSIIPKNCGCSLQAGCGTVSAVADCLSLFALFRVAAGAAAAGCLLCRFVYCLELSVTSNRTAAGFVSNIFMTLGYAILALLAYLLRDWRYLMLAVSLPGILLLGFWW